MNEFDTCQRSAKLVLQKSAHYNVSYTPIYTQITGSGEESVITAWQSLSQQRLKDVEEI